MAAIYTALIELVGIRDLAFENSDEFNSMYSDFQETLFEAYVNINFDFEKKEYIPNIIGLDGFQEFYACKSSNLKILIKFVNEVRTRLFNDRIFCRIILDQIDYQIIDEKEENRDDINDSEEFIKVRESYNYRSYNAVTAELYSELIAFKGIGIFLKAIVLSELQKLNDKNIFLNYFIEDQKYPIIVPYFDYRYESNFSSDNVVQLCEEFQKSYNLNSKLARFFIPAFNNLIISWNYRTSNQFQEVRNDETRSVESLLLNNYFNDFKRINGISLTYLFFVGKLLEGELFCLSSANPHSLKINDLDYIFARLRSNSWLVNQISSSKMMTFPKSLYNSRIKRQLILS